MWSPLPPCCLAHTHLLTPARLPLWQIGLWSMLACVLQAHEQPAIVQCAAPATQPTLACSFLRMLVSPCNTMTSSVSYVRIDPIVTGRVTVEVLTTHATVLPTCVSGFLAPISVFQAVHHCLLKPPVAAIPALVHGRAVWLLTVLLLKPSA